MTRGSVIIPSVILVAGARALAMSASSFWAGILRCSGTSPAFTIAGTPKGTASLRAPYVSRLRKIGSPRLLA